MNIFNGLRSLKSYYNLPKEAKEAIKRDSVNLHHLKDLDEELVLSEVLSWMLRSQEYNKHSDDGYARDFSFLNGWASSYPETTGYIVPTLIDASRFLNREDLKISAKKALDWLVSIQLEEGGFQGGKIDSLPKVPVTFNTGQILLGLSAGVEEFGEKYADSTHKAANWLCETIDQDGCWRKYPTPFAANGEKA